MSGISCQKPSALSPDIWHLKPDTCLKLLEPVPIAGHWTEKRFRSLARRTTGPWKGADNGPGFCGPRRKPKMERRLLWDLAF